MRNFSRQITAGASSISELLKDCPKNQIIGDNLVRAWSKINSPLYKKVLCSLSGGSDSDVMLDIVFRCDVNKKVDYVWYDTGLEYEATKEHLRNLEKRYQIKIKPYKAIKSIPTSCREYGQPFLNKRASEYIYRLQQHSFSWEDRPYEELIQEYPRCQSALKWWCNENEPMKNGRPSRLNIDNNLFLKQFMIANPPWFKISNKCCLYAKENVAGRLIREEGYDLSITGLRKAEGGARAIAYKSCFDEGNGGCANYRPLFWYKNEDKKCYKDAYFIENSRCYSEYGLKRTGCAGCPNGRELENELDVLRKYEPKLYLAVINIFGDSYEYKKMYMRYKEKMSKFRRAI